MIHGTSQQVPADAARFRGRQSNARLRPEWRVRFTQAFLKRPLRPRGPWPRPARSTYAARYAARYAGIDGMWRRQSQISAVLGAARPVRHSAATPEC